MARVLPQTVPLLVLFWLVLSGHYTVLLLALGAVSVAVVATFTVRAGLAEVASSFTWRLLRLPGYLAWLALQVLTSALAVARAAWSPRIKLAPVVDDIPMPPMSPLGQVTYANSITLTPGTLALDVHDEHIRVHSLDIASIEALRSGGMARRVHRLEGRR